MIGSLLRDTFVMQGSSIDNSTRAAQRVGRWDKEHISDLLWMRCLYVSYAIRKEYVNISALL
jgi:hypothetical protein